MECRMETERLIIRRLRDGDARSMYENHSDDEVERWFPNERYADPNEAREAIRFFGECVDGGRLPFVLGAELKETGELIGDAGISEVEGRARGIEVGYCIGRKYRRRGYATELLRAITEHAAACLEGGTIYGRVVRGNDASARVLEKNAYRFVEMELGAEDDPYGSGMMVYKREL